MEACEDVYACGDIVRFPLPLVGSTASIGHWQIAHNHGNKSYCIINLIIMMIRLRSHHCTQHVREETKI